MGQQSTLANFLRAPKKLKASSGAGVAVLPQVVAEAGTNPELPHHREGQMKGKDDTTSETQQKLPLKDVINIASSPPRVPSIVPPGSPRRPSIVPPRSPRRPSIAPPGSPSVPSVVPPGSPRRPSIAPPGSLREPSVVPPGNVGKAQRAAEKGEGGERAVEEKDFPRKCRSPPHTTEQTDSVLVNGGSSATLSPEVRARCEINRALALAKRAARAAEERAEESRASGASFPPLHTLLVSDSWQPVLAPEFRKAYLEQLEKFLRQEASGKVPIYPPAHSVFRAFNSCPFDQVKVVIIGQDPYHGPNQAMGLCFSVPAGTRCPPSLLNVFKEIRDDVACQLPPHGNLEKWAAQGVLLLNTVLTVRAGHANSHARKGWEHFTDAAIRALNQQREGVVFLLWGAHAQEKCKMIDRSRHRILTAPHPSGLSAHRGFIGCKHFSKANALLESMGHIPIDWQL